jgi:eukaryotic-like serine/threonine-protein kinase
MPKQSAHENILKLLEPGALLGGPLFQSFVSHTERKLELPIGLHLGPFALKAEIGRGGMGVVYQAERADGEFQQQVAIKCLANRLGEQQDQGLMMFRHERQLLSELKHPNIARLIDAGSNSDVTWFAMEIVNGLTIDHQLQAMPRAANARINLILQLTDAVSAAHARLLVHRDIKPSNVMVDADGSVKLLDFGIAQLQSDTHKNNAYSPHWASPEQQRLQTIGPASDQYQIGRILELAIADLSVSGERGMELKAITTRAVADDPARRYGSVDELARDLRDWLAFKPVRAKDGGLAYSLRCLFRRRPWASAAVVCATLSAIAATAWFNWQLQQQRDVARDAAARAERAQLRQGNLVRFLTDDLLFQGNLYEGAGLETPVSKLLERAEKKLLDPQQLPAPEFIPLLNSIAEVYLSHFKGEAAQRFLQTSQNIAKANPNAVSNSEMLEISYRLASNFLVLSQPEQALPLLQQIDAQAQALDANADTAINAGADLAWSYYETSDFPAMRLQLQQLRLRLQRVDQMGRHAVLYAQQIAAILSYIDDQAQRARSELLDVRANLRRSVADNHASILRVDRNLAVIERETGNCARALVQFSDINARSTTLPALDRSWTASELGVAHLQCGQTSLALELLASSYQVRLTLLGNKYIRTRQSAINYARALLASNRARDAQTLLANTCPAIAQQFNGHHWQYGQCMAAWAQTQSQLGMLSEAKQSAQIALDALAPLPAFVHQNGKRLQIMREILAL